MKADLLIKNGKVIDSATGLLREKDVAIKESKIVDENVVLESKIVIDASDCIVSAGLIDHHLHMHYEATEAGVPADITLLPSGVTTGVDAGSNGFSTFEAFNKNVIQRSIVRIKSYLNVSPTGMITRKYPENINPKFYDIDKMANLFEKYKKYIVGLKLRVSKDLYQEFSSNPIEETLKMAEILGCRIVVHVTDPFVDSEELASLLRPGDVFCHCFHGRGNTIIDRKGRVKKGIKEAYKKGLIFDACNGKYNFSFDVGSASIDQGFYPNVISTDMNTMVLFQHPAFSLPYVMSKYLNMGMPLASIFKAVTETPAKLLGLSNVIGNLEVGSAADVAVFRVLDQKTVFYDDTNQSIIGKQIIAPQMTIKDGRILYRDVRFTKELNR